MRKDEFVEKHGEGAWEEFVRPVQESTHTSHVQKANANLTADLTLAAALKLLGFEKGVGLLEAKRRIEEAGITRRVQ